MWDVESQVPIPIPTDVTITRDGSRNRDYARVSKSRESVSSCRYSPCNLLGAAVMLARRICPGIFTPSRSYSSGTIRPVPVLPDASVETFRKDAFDPAQPALLPKASQARVPAASTWFLQPQGNRRATQLNIGYFQRHRQVTVPLEITNDGNFVRMDYSLGFFLEFVWNHSDTKWLLPQSRTRKSDHPSSAHALPTAKIYIAQASLADLPKEMQADLPTPELVLNAGKGDVYDSSLWLGQAPTYTPLHRDPNPNLFVQLAGKKVVRLYAPRTGNAIFSKVQEVIGGSASATMRGEEMMQGREKELLEQEVWGDGEDTVDGAMHAELDAGDALFIPKGWWHSIKGVGDSINGSVNWWFR